SGFLKLKFLPCGNPLYGFDVACVHMNMVLVDKPPICLLIPFCRPWLAERRITRIKIPQKTPNAVISVLNGLADSASIISFHLTLLNLLFSSRCYHWSNFRGTVCRNKSS